MVINQVCVNTLLTKMLFTLFEFGESKEIYSVLS